MEKIIPNDETIRQIEQDNPDAATTERWRLAQAEAKRRREPRRQAE